MKITVIGRKCTPRDSFRERAEKRLQKVEKFFASDVSIILPLALSVSR